jgi:hypothetical protein
MTKEYEQFDRLEQIAMGVLYALISRLKDPEDEEEEIAEGESMAGTIETAILYAECLEERFKQLRNPPRRK